MADLTLPSELCSADNNGCLQMSDNVYFGVFRVYTVCSFMLWRHRGAFAKFKCSCSLDQSSYPDIWKKGCFVVAVGTWQLQKNSGKKWTIWSWRLVFKKAKYSVGLQQLRRNKSRKFVSISLVLFSEIEFYWVFSCWWEKQDKETKLISFGAMLLKTSNMTAQDCCIYLELLLSSI